MLFQVNEDKLKRRLKFYIPISFIIMACISVGSYSILLRTIYQLENSLIGYVYLFILLLMIVIPISMFFDCLKVEKGKYIPLGKIFVIKSGIAVILVAIVSYTIHLLTKKVTLFEIVNIRLTMVIFLITIAMTFSSIFFNILVRPLYKKTGRKEYYLPMVYSFLPASMATMIFIVTLINGLHYRSEIVYDSQYDMMLKKGYANDFINNFYDGMSKYVTVADNISTYMNIIRGDIYTLNNYVETLSSYLSTRYANDHNISGFSIFIRDFDNINISLNTEGMNNLAIEWKYDVNNLVTISTNLRPNLSGNNLAKMYDGTNSIVDIIPNSDVFYIYEPIILNNKNIGLISLEVRSSVYQDILSDIAFKNNLDIFITDDLYIIKASNNPAALGAMQRDLDNAVVSADIKDTRNNNYRNNISNIKIIPIKNTNKFAIKYSVF
ncbi:methyl-accepting chemotaxis protein, partial [Brachyspira innocens]|nr:methyl-accepting chemotaxis protein [Brachyspira innocens]